MYRYKPRFFWQTNYRILELSIVKNEKKAKSLAEVVLYIHNTDKISWLKVIIVCMEKRQVILVAPFSGVP